MCQRSAEVYLSKQTNTSVWAGVLRRGLCHPGCTGALPQVVSGPLNVLSVWELPPSPRCLHWAPPAFLRHRRLHTLLAASTCRALGFNNEQSTHGALGFELQLFPSGWRGCAGISASSSPCSGCSSLAAQEQGLLFQECLLSKLCSSALGAQGVTFLRGHAWHLGCIDCSVSAPSAQELCTALKGESRWRINQGKGRREKTFPVLGMWPPRTTLLFRELFPSFSQFLSLKNKLGLPPSCRGLLDSTGRKRGVLSLQLDLVICFGPQNQRTASGGKGL